MQHGKFNIVMPAKNEAASLRTLLPQLVEQCPEADIIVVDDGSDDDTLEICSRYSIEVVRHPYSKGNGAAIKSGARAAKHDIIVFMDADSQHQPEFVRKLVARLEDGFDMVVAERYSNGHASVWRSFANNIYNRFASLVTGHSVKDLTSGFRAVRAVEFSKFLYLLPNGFSYPTSITMAFFRVGYSITYMPINVRKRIGNSHIRPIRDGIRFLLIIFRIGTLYSPLKIFFPLSLLFFASGIMHYAYVYITQGRFTNMSAVLFITALLVFLIGLVSEQITTLLYSRDD